MNIRLCVERILILLHTASQQHIFLPNQILQQEYQALRQKKQMQDYQLGNEEKMLQVEGQKEIDTLVKQVKAFVKDYGKKNGYTFILGANEAGSVMYGADDKDITEDVIKALNGDTKEESKTKE